MGALGSSWRKSLGGSFFSCLISQESYSISFSTMLSSKDLLQIQTWALRTVFLLRFYYLFVCLLFWKDNFKNCAQYRSRSLLSFHLYKQVQKHIMPVSPLLQQYCGRSLRWYCLHRSLHSRTQWWFSLGLTMWKAIISSYKDGNFLTFLSFLFLIYKSLPSFTQLPTPASPPWSPSLHSWRWNKGAAAVTLQFVCHIVTFPHPPHSVIKVL